MSSNQHREIDVLLDDITHADLKAATEALRLEIGRHPGDATCECPTLETLAVLYERGYRLIKT